MDASPALSRLEPGDVVGTYTIVDRLASGAMGAVYRASVSLGGQAPQCHEVALKRLIDPAQADRAEVEARLLARLDHPRVSRVIEYLREGEGVYLVMELVEGRDLGVILDADGSPGLPRDDVIRWTVEICEALDYIHDENVVHRDVKPRNIVVGPAGAVLVDFGIARELVAGDSGTRAIGTPRFMAPEVLVGEPVSPRSDVYGLAATAWALLTGEPPGMSNQASLGDPELEAILRKGLELRPERRLASASALAAALGSPIGPSTGVPLSLSAERSGDDGGARELLEGIVRTAAGAFEAAAASLAFVDGATGELVYEAAWGAGADEIAGVRLPPGAGLSGAALEAQEPIAVPDCRSDSRFAEQIAAGTGYVPRTMLVVPLPHGAGVLSVLDRRSGVPYGAADIPPAELFADLATTAQRFFARAK